MLLFIWFGPRHVTIHLIWTQTCYYSFDLDPDMLLFIWFGPRHVTIHLIWTQTCYYSFDFGPWHVTIHLIWTLTCYYSFDLDPDMLLFIWFGPWHVTIHLIWTLTCLLFIWFGPRHVTIHLIWTLTCYYSFDLDPDMLLFIWFGPWHVTIHLIWTQTCYYSFDLDPDMLLFIWFRPRHVTTHPTRHISSLFSKCSFFCTLYVRMNKIHYIPQMDNSNCISYAIRNSISKVPSVLCISNIGSMHYHARSKFLCDWIGDSKYLWIWKSIRDRIGKAESW